MNQTLFVTLVVSLATAAEPGTKEQAGSSAGLQNGGFESAAVQPGWSVHVYGAEPRLALDTAVFHEGRQALRVSADELSDTALGQEVQLQPGRWYRLTAWVRTQQLDPHGAPVYGTLQIQNPGGRGVIASGQNHGGTSDWTQETICFMPPGDGLTRIAIFFVGYGKGTGAAWFDAIALDEIDATVSRLTVTRQPLCPGRISPFQYGQFIEYLCGLTLSMSAEQVHDASFEGVPPYGFEFRKETDRIEKPWYPDEAVQRGQYALDIDRPFNGRVAQRITCRPGDPCTLGISQGGKCVRRGQPLKCSLHLRSQGLDNPVRVTLWGEGQTYAVAEFTSGPEWQKFEATLTPTGSDANATLTISFRSSGAREHGSDSAQDERGWSPGSSAVWIDQVSLLPADHVFGWRRDVAEALKALKPGIIRFGGSTTEGFDWTATIGDPAKRVPFTTCWGGLEPGNAGLEEFVQLCQWVGAEPLICVRFTDRTPQDAADQVDLPAPLRLSESAGDGGECAAVPIDACRPGPRPRHPLGDHRVEYDGRRLGFGPRDAVDAGQRARLCPLPQLDAPPLRRDRDRQPQQPGRQLLQRRDSDEQPRPVQDADVLRPGTVCQPRRANSVGGPFGRGLACRPGFGRQRHPVGRRRRSVGVRGEPHGERSSADA